MVHGMCIDECTLYVPSIYTQNTSAAKDLIFSKVTCSALTGFPVYRLQSAAKNMLQIEENGVCSVHDCPVHLQSSISLIPWIFRWEYIVPKGSASSGHMMT